jgi:hypothetical protein
MEPVTTRDTIQACLKGGIEWEHKAQPARQPDRQAARQAARRPD